MACKLGICQRARKVKFKQEDGSFLEGKFVVNILFNVIDTSFILGNLTMDTEVLDIGNRDVILELSWWTENGFSVDTEDRCLRNVTTGQIIPCSVRLIYEVLIMKEEPL